MDWSKAKNILIIALVITNLFLLSVHFYEKRTGGKDNEQILSQVLAEKNIEIRCGIPKNTGRMPAVFVEYRNVTGEEAQALTEAMEILSDKAQISDYEEIAFDYISYLGLSSEYTEICQVIDLRDTQPTGDEAREENEEHILFAEAEPEIIVRTCCVIDGTVLEDSFCEVGFRDGRICSCRSSGMLPAGSSEGEFNTISAPVALLTFMNTLNIRERSITITDISMCYYVVEDHEAEGVIADTAFPAWRIMTAEGFVYHVEAIERQ